MVLQFPLDVMVLKILLVPVGFLDSIGVMVLLVPLLLKVLLVVKVLVLSWG